MEKMKLGFDTTGGCCRRTPSQLVVGGVPEGRGGSVELVCAHPRLLALSLELELAHLDAGGGGRRFSACFRSFATRWTATTVYERACEGRGSTGGVYGCSKCTLPVYHMLSASSTSSQRSENTPKTACRRLLRQDARAQERERERADAGAHTQARPTRRGLQAPHRWQVVMECGGNSHLLSKPSFIFSM